MLVTNNELLNSNDINKELHGDEEDRKEEDINYKIELFIRNNVVDNNINCEMLSCVLTPKILEDSIPSILIDRDSNLIRECINNLSGFIDRISDNIFPYLNTLEDELVNLLNNHYEVKGKPLNILKLFLELRGVMSQFIDIGFIASNRRRFSVPTNNRDVEDRNIVYTFRGNKLLEIVPDIYNEPNAEINSETKNELAEDCFTYAYCFLLFINIAIVYSALRETLDNIDNKTLKRLIYAVENKTKLALLTGFKVSCELTFKDIDFHEIFLDLKELSPKNPREIGIKCNDEKRVITITIHNNVLVTQALRNEGYRRVWNFYDKSLDNKSTGEIKILEGSTPNSIKISVYITGKSGTGKSTHTRLWRENIEGAFLLNDDSPFLRVEDGKVWAYGSPWSGKTPCYKQEKYELAGCVRLSQAPYNKIKKLSVLHAYAAIHPSCPPEFAYDNAIYDHISHFINGLLSSVKFYHLECLPDKEAALLSFNTLFADEADSK